MVKVRRESSCSFRETAGTPGGPVIKWFGAGEKAKGRIGAMRIEVVDDGGGCCEMDTRQRTDTFV
jgi:hypothetical protein